MSESAEHAMADVAHANEGYGNCRNVSPNAAVGLVHRHSRTKVFISSILRIATKLPVAECWASHTSGSMATLAKPGPM